MGTVERLLPWLGSLVMLARPDREPDGYAMLRMLGGSMLNTSCSSSTTRFVAHWKEVVVVPVF